MNDQAIRFRFGIFLLASLILLAVLVILFGGFPSYFKRTDSYTINFANANGLAPGTPVKRSGVRIGEVSSVALDNLTGKVQVGIRVDDKYTIRTVDRPTLMQSLFGGESAIAFMPPDDPKLQADAATVEPGAVLEGVTPADAGAVLQRTADLVQPAAEAFVEIKKVFQGINEMKPIVDQTLKDFQEISKMVQRVGPDLELTSKEIRALAKASRDTIPDLKKTNGEISDLAKATRETIRTWNRVGERTEVLIKTNEDKITKSVERMDEALKRINNVLSDQNQKYLTDTLKNFRDSSQQLEGLTKDSRTTLKQLSDSLKRADDTLSDLQKAMKPFTERGPRIFKNIDDSADNLNKTLKDLRELIQLAGRSDGTVQKLLTDPALYNNLNDSATMVTRILPRLDRVLRDVEVFADKVARHPELLGVRGAIVPSVGLKEPPSVIPYRVIP
jgi:phospholipid/cholesterol/gamma-HCH transport system substrate-binding protein